MAITNAEAEAQKTSIAADAQAEANRKLAESLSDTLIEYQKIQKWDGKLLTIGLVNDMFTERQNDDYPYKELASQEDFDRF